MDFAKKILRKKRRENHKKGFHLSTIVFALMVRFFMGNLALEGLTNEKKKLAKGNKGGDSLFACWGILRDLAHPLKGGNGLMGETRLSLFSLFSWWVPLLIFLFWIDQTQDHNSLFPCFNIFFIYIFVYIYLLNKSLFQLFEVLRCMNLSSSFFLLYREASYGHGPRGC